METEDKVFGMCEHTEEGYAEYGTLLKVNDYQVRGLYNSLHYTSRCRVVQITPDGRSFVDCVGTTRFRVTERSILDAYNTAKVLLTSYSTC
jgi:Lon protease-like protein